MIKQTRPQKSIRTLTIVISFRYLTKRDRNLSFFEFNRKEHKLGSESGHPFFRESYICVFLWRFSERGDTTTRRFLSCP